MIKTSHAVGQLLGFVGFAEHIFWLDSRFRGNDGYSILYISFFN